MIELPFSTCDRVYILDNIFHVEVSRIGFNEWDSQDGEFQPVEEIDPRIVHVAPCGTLTSPPYNKVMGLRASYAPGVATDIDNPRKASSLEVSFSSLIGNYTGLSRMLTRSCFRKVKMNLPAHEVAMFSHRVPVYLAQYSAYYYVNKISNYVAGKLCEVELIQL
jgi:hypothetical protein